MPTQVRPGRLALPLAALVVFLAACTSIGETPLPAPVPVEEPGPVLDLSCAETLAPEDLAAVLGPTVALRVDAADPVSDARSALLRQVGAVECVWGGDVTLGRVYAEGLRFIALPHAADDFAERLLPVIDTQYTNVDGIGDHSQFACSFQQCAFDLLVSDVWVGGWLTAPSSTDDAALEIAVEPLLSRIADAVAAAASGAAEAAPTPPGVLASWGACEDESPFVSGLREVLGKADLYPAGEPMPVLELVAAERSGSATCSLWADDLTLIVTATLVPGAGWALDDLGAASVEDATLGPFQRLEVAGAERAVAACVDGVGCTALLEIQGSLASLRMQPADRVAFEAALPSFVRLATDTAPPTT